MHVIVSKCLNKYGIQVTFSWNLSKIEKTSLIVIINKVLPATKVECNETCKIFENVPNLPSAAMKPRVTTTSVIFSETVVYNVLSWEL